MDTKRPALPRADESTLGEMHHLIARHFIDRLRSGEITPSELSAACRFLKDNGIEALPERNDDLGELMATLPDYREQPDPEADIVLN